ncbi:hypothetical protein pCM2_0038 (plasmid) [Clavibacter michiganensis subsp. michiganensis NCPPB 382]|uniref:Uncharacterized protein n=1 Tax=Clavibacter michiganensis subsp. michiganensis (strain NCPPB 382) TaxID=443906 RepID=A5CLQ1_CLAM3|nr:hypothetical protein [Clavibacter michiganensis]CAM98522.1 hypothetical protein pCM2_0038 [Clavibacter michiganensis subsp. michiganensis NCPPB 382]
MPDGTIRQSLCSGEGGMSGRKAKASRAQARREAERGRRSGGGGSVAATLDPEVGPIPLASDIAPYLGDGAAAKAFRDGAVALIELGQREHAYFGRDPARVTAAEDADGRDILVTSDELPEEWTELFARSIMWLRTSLDYLAYELTMSHTPDVDPRVIGFPISRRPWDAKAKAREKIAGMSPQAQQIIEELQPYHTPEEDRPHHPLIVLDELRQLYAHRRPAVMLTAVQSTSALTHPVVMRGNVKLDIGRPVFDSDTPFATPCLPSSNPFRGTDYAGGPEREYPTWAQVNFDVCMGPDTAVSDGTRIHQMMNHLYNQIQEHVLAPLLGVQMSQD